jgi:hypothetical protein
MSRSSGSNFGGPGFKSRPENWLSWLRFFVIFLSPCKKMAGQCIKLNHHRFLPHLFPIYYSQTILFLTLYRPDPSYWKYDYINQESKHQGYVYLFNLKNKTFLVNSTVESGFLQPCSRQCNVEVKNAVNPNSVPPVWLRDSMLRIGKISSLFLLLVR